MFPKDYDGIIVDAGGYIGTTALKLSDMYPTATIVTIEPSSENMSILERNIIGRQHIFVINAALVHKCSGPVNLFDPGREECGYTIIDGSLAQHNDTFGLETTDVVTLEDISDKFHNKSIGMLKLDVEGAEKNLFENGTNGLIEKIPVIFVELHDRFVEGCTLAFEHFATNKWILNLGDEKYLSLSKKEFEPISAENR